MKKRILALFLALVSLLALAACGATPAKDPPASASEPVEADGGVEELILDTYDQTPNTVKSDETLVVVLSAEPSTLIPEKTGSTFQSGFVQALLCDRLLNYDTINFELEPGLLVDWEWIDPLHLRVEVRKGVTCYDGTEFVAEDVLWSIKNDSEKRARGYGSTFNVDNCVIEDDYHLILEFARQDPGFLYALTDSANIIDKSSYEANGGDDGNRTNPRFGTGPYKFVEWIPGQYILLERNENYWDPDLVCYYKYIKFTFVADTATRIMAVQSGDANIALDVSIGQAIEFKDNPEVTFYAIEAEQNIGIGLNVSEKRGSPLQDRRVREAVRYAIDTAALNQVFSCGYASIQHFVIKSNSVYYTDPTDGAGVPEVDLEKAKELLAEAGYPGGGFKLVTAIRPDVEDLATAVQAMLAQIGIELEILLPDTGTLVPILTQGNYDLSISRVPSLAYFRTWDYFSMFSPRENDTYRNGPKADDDYLQSLVDVAIQSLDEDEVREATAAYQKHIYDQIYHIGVCSDICCGVCTKGLIGFRVSTRELVDIRRVHPKQ